MRKALATTVALAVAACGSAIDRNTIIDTTLSNRVLPLSGYEMAADTLVTDLNTTEDMGMMTDNLAAIDSMTATDSAMYDSPSPYQPMVDPYVSDAERAADNLEMTADNLESMVDND